MSGRLKKVIVGLLEGKQKPCLDVKGLKGDLSDSPIVLRGASVEPNLHKYELNGGVVRAKTCSLLSQHKLKKSSVTLEANPVDH